MDHIFDVLLSEDWNSGCHCPDDRDAPAPGGRGHGQSPGLELLLFQKTFPFDSRKVVLNRSGIDSEIPADLSDRRGVLVRLKIVLNEIQNRLLFLRKHGRSYTRTFV